MFGRGPRPPSDGVTGRGDASVVQPPTPAPAPHPFVGVQQFNGHQPVYSPFTPTDCNQLSYTFSSVAPPTYSWANTNSTDIMK